MNFLKGVINQILNPTREEIYQLISTGILALIFYIYIKYIKNKK